MPGEASGLCVPASPGGGAAGGTRGAAEEPVPLESDSSGAVCEANTLLNVSARRPPASAA